MPSCREIDPLFTPYIDGEATADQRAVVDAHLEACPKCRHQTALQTAVRETVRDEAVSALCTRRAADALSRRCPRRHGPFGTTRSTITSLSLAAALVLVLGGVLLYTLTRSVAYRPRRAAHARPREVLCRRTTPTPVDARAGEAAVRARLRARGSSAARARSPGCSWSGCADAFAAKAPRRTRCIGSTAAPCRCMSFPTRIASARRPMSSGTTR